MNARIRYMLAVAAFAVLSTGARARADVLPPNMDGCAGKAVGSKCLTDDGQSGECTETQWGKRAPGGSSSGQKVVVCTAPLPPTNSGIAQEGASSESDARAELPLGAVVGVGAAGAAALGAVIAFAMRRRRRGQ